MDSTGLVNGQGFGYALTVAKCTSSLTSLIGNLQNPNTSWAEVLIAAHMLRVNYLAKHKLLSDLETFDLGKLLKQKILASGIPNFNADFDPLLSLSSERQVVCNVRVTLIEPWQQVEQVSGMWRRGFSLWTSMQHLPSGDCYDIMVTLFR